VAGAAKARQGRARGKGDHQCRLRPGTLSKRVKQHVAPGIEVVQSAAIDPLPVGETPGQGIVVDVRWGQAGQTEDVIPGGKFV
jgi:hypothetical protein